MKRDQTKHQERVPQTKTRWGWRNLLYDVEGNVIEEKLLDKDGNVIVELQNENADETEEERIT